MNGTAVAKKRKLRYVSESRGEPIFQLFLTLFFILLSITFLYPYWSTIVTSFTHKDMTGTAGFNFWPKKFTIDAYTNMLKPSSYIWTGYGNTIIICAMGLLTSISGVVLAAYPLSKRDLPFRTVFTLIITITMFISGGMIPTFLLVSRTLNMTGSYWAVVLPQCISVYNIIVARNYFMGLPLEIEEAATIDGANSWQVLWRIILPLSLPILATLSLWVTVSNWNAYFNCMLYIKEPKKQVLQLVLRSLILNNSVEEVADITSGQMQQSGMDNNNLQAVAITASTIPILAVYPFVQKYFVKGVLVGSVKG